MRSRRRPRRPPLRSRNRQHGSLLTLRLRQRRQRRHQGRRVLLDPLGHTRVVARHGVLDRGGVRREPPVYEAVRYWAHAAGEEGAACHAGYWRAGCEEGCAEADLNVVGRAVYCRRGGFSCFLSMHILFSEAVEYIL